MNGNYEFVRQMARDRQRELANEAREQRLARQAGSPGGTRRQIALYVRTGAWLHGATNWVARRATSHVASWKAALQKPGVAPR